MGENTRLQLYQNAREESAEVCTPPRITFHWGWGTRVGWPPPVPCRSRGWRRASRRATLLKGVLGAGGAGGGREGRLFLAKQFSIPPWTGQSYSARSSRKNHACATKRHLLGQQISIPPWSMAVWKNFERAVRTKVCICNAAGPTTSLKKSSPHDTSPTVPLIERRAVLLAAPECGVTRKRPSQTEPSPPGSASAARRRFGRSRFEPTARLSQPLPSRPRLSWLSPTPSPPRVVGADASPDPSVASSFVASSCSIVRTDIDSRRGQ